MLAKKMYKSAKHKKDQISKSKKRHKAIKVTTLTAIGIGATVGATMVYRKSKAKKNEEYDNYMYNMENYNEEYNDEYNNEYGENKTIQEDDELKEKVSEFNSTRLSYDNEAHSSVEEMSKFMNQLDADNID